MVVYLKIFITACVFRYVDKIKFIVLSAPLIRVHWHQAVQLGWFCYFAIVPDSDEICNVQPGKFLWLSLFFLLSLSGFHLL